MICTKTSLVLGNKGQTDSITMAARANSPRFQSFQKSKRESLQSLLEQKVWQAFQTCQTCRFRNLVVNQTQIPSPPSLPFSELAPIKHTLGYSTSGRMGDLRGLTSQLPSSSFGRGPMPRCGMHSGSKLAISS